MNLFTILLIVVAICAIGSAPLWPHSREWGYRPTGLLWVVVIVLLIMFLFGGYGGHGRLWR